MTTSINDAVLFCFVMAAAIFFCRVFPFLFFREKTKTQTEDGKIANRRKTAFLNIVEKTVPPAAMTVLTFNALVGSAMINPVEIIPAALAAGFTVAVHLWRRNPLISIFGGTALFMLLQRLIG